MNLAPIRARKRQAEQEITRILEAFCREVRPSNISMDLHVSRLEQWGEDAPADIMFAVNITCEV